MKDPDITIVPIIGTRAHETGLSVVIEIPGYATWTMSPAQAETLCSQLFHAAAFARAMARPGDTKEDACG